MIVVDNIAVDGYKTKAVVVNMLKALVQIKSVDRYAPCVDEKLIASANNIPGVKTALGQTP